MVATPNYISKTEVGTNWVSVDEGHPRVGVTVEVKWEDKPHKNSTDTVINYPLLMWKKGYNHTHWRYT